MTSYFRKTAIYVYNLPETRWYLAVLASDATRAMNAFKNIWLPKHQGEHCWKKTASNVDYIMED